MLYTGYYANMKRAPKNGEFEFVCISRSVPGWFQDEFDFLKAPFLAPSSFAEVELLKKGDNAAKTRYTQKITSLIERAKANFNDNTIFLCHEKDAHECHRMLLRNALNRAGIPCKEIYFEKDGSFSILDDAEDAQMKVEDLL